MLQFVTDVSLSYNITFASFLDFIYQHCNQFAREQALLDYDGVCSTKLALGIVIYIAPASQRCHSPQDLAREPRNLLTSLMLVRYLLIAAEGVWFMIMVMCRDCSMYICDAILTFICPVFCSIEAI